jgi:hypothetical protein
MNAPELTQNPGLTSIECTHWGDLEMRLVG